MVHRRRALDIAAAVIAAAAVSAACAFVIQLVASAINVMIHAYMPDWAPPQWQRDAIGYGICVVGAFLVLVPIVLFVLMAAGRRLARPYRLSRRPKTPASTAVKGPNDERRVVISKLIDRVNESERREREARTQLVRARDEAGLEEWHITDLAETHRALNAAGLIEARDRLERVLEDIQPAWRLYA
jgi:hypothetical protein